MTDDVYHDAEDLSTVPVEFGDKVEERKRGAEFEACMILAGKSEHAPDSPLVDTPHIYDFKKKCEKCERLLPRQQFRKLSHGRLDMYCVHCCALLGEAPKPRWSKQMHPDRRFKKHKVKKR